MYTRNKYCLVLLFPVFCLINCNVNGQDNSVTEKQKKAKEQMESVHKLAAQTARTYKEMDNPALLKKLAEQSKQKKEPFNCLAYRELQTRTNVDSEALVSMVRDSKNADGLLPLLLLRKLDRPVYLKLLMKERADVLTDALQQSKYFNTWGIPPFYLEDASRAMLECDSAAFPALRRMLAETRPAPVFGSKEYMIYQRNQYRLCDYALLFLKYLQGDTRFVLPASPADRDSLIRDIGK
jgi:hypothetical protein